MTEGPDGLDLRGARPRPGGTLLVVAVEEEAQHFPPSWPVLVTGAGKVNAATATTAACLRWLPGLLVNAGTAGALTGGHTGTHEIGEVRQHDLDDTMLHRLTGRHFGPPLRLRDDGPVLVTGDVFVADPVIRDRLAASGADLVDMEGYAVARAARAAGVPVRLVKHVSDGADEAAVLHWPDLVAACSRELAAWCGRHLGLPG